MRLLGAVLAGGRSSRFGSDKAMALYRGIPLLDRVAASLAAETDSVVIVGRSGAGLPHIADRPGAGLGPLGGLCASLHHAAAHGFDAVLTAACDLPRLPTGLSARLAPGPAAALGQPTLGLWPAALAGRLDAHIAAGGRSLHGWIDAAGARLVDLGPMPNINTPADLALLR